MCFFTWVCTCECLCPQRLEKKNASCPGTGITGYYSRNWNQVLSTSEQELGFKYYFFNIKILLLDFASISCKYPVIKTKCSGHNRSGACGMFCLSGCRNSEHHHRCGGPLTFLPITPPSSWPSSLSPSPFLTPPPPLLSKSFSHAIISPHRQLLCLIILYINVRFTGGTG